MPMQPSREGSPSAVNKRLSSSFGQHYNEHPLPLNSTSHTDNGISPSPASYSTSVSQRTPTRSFFPGSFHGPADTTPSYSSPGVRERTAELAKLALAEGTRNNISFSLPSMATSMPTRGDTPQPDTLNSEDQSNSANISFLPQSEYNNPSTNTSALTTLLNSPVDERRQSNLAVENAPSYPHPSIAVYAPDDVPEQASLINKNDRLREYGSLHTNDDIENQRYVMSSESRPLPTSEDLGLIQRSNRCFGFKNWNKHALWQNIVLHPATLLPSVFLGLLLNILDALSYGMILFPLAQPIFKDLGADGISMFYVSTVIAQLAFSGGLSIFKGGIGSEMIEVVPFFHKMAFIILTHIGDDNPKAVLATTVLSYALSSILTGFVFFLMGHCGLGSLIGFFPRHILIGCIGGVGWFLVVTGIEVSGRLSGGLEYNLDVLQQLFQTQTLLLWTIPLILAVVLLVLTRFIKSNFLVGGYFILVTVIFYIVKFVFGISMQTLRDHAWVFAVPSSNAPWYHFYTLYDFSVVNWSALLETIPAMLALTFFGILHVPINVPALGISIGEDNVDLDKELIAHGITNALSGLAGSIQNYLVYTNSLLFIASGGSDRLAGIMLAFATFGILLAGPVIIGYIPIMVVGALIYMLGIELLQEALVDTWGKLNRLEYATVIIIVVAMSAWDFVQGIIVGIILACVSFVVQTSRKSAIRAIYSGQVAISTIRRHPLHARFLKEAGRQTCIIKLTGFLFFGTIVDVEKKIRGLIEEDAFSERPIRFLVLELSHVNGLDFSAAEAFTRLNRMVSRRRVRMVISGLDVHNDIGRSLQNVGLFLEENQVGVFEDLNSALEYCENELLEAFHYRTDALTRNNQQRLPLILDRTKSHRPSFSEMSFNSPRAHYLHEVAATTLGENADVTENFTSQKWSSFQQPLPLLLQTFHGLSEENEDFWFLATPYFTRATYPVNSILYREGEEPKSFYLLESGILRADYETPQGNYYELIVASRPCGELPFFGETPRTATVRAEDDCVVWFLSREKWEELKEREPKIAQELLRVCLKLTTERMESITSYVLTTA